MYQFDLSTQYLPVDMYSRSIVSYPIFYVSPSTAHSNGGSLGASYHF